MPQMDLSQIIYNYAFVLGGVGVALWAMFKYGVHRSVETHFEELRDELKPIRQMIDEMDSRTSRIEYALYNDGLTGLINKVDSLIENQQIIKVDVEVMKAKYDS